MPLYSASFFCGYDRPVGRSLGLNAGFQDSHRIVCITGGLATGSRVHAVLVRLTAFLRLLAQDVQELNGGRRRDALQASMKVAFKLVNYSYDSSVRSEVGNVAGRCC